MIKILAIGNSFSNNALRYLYPMAASAGREIKTVNLFIPSCPLEIHWKNMKSGEQAYEYELNGKSTERRCSIDEALAEENWDFITFQQASEFSGMPETYEPFLTELYRYVKQRVPDAAYCIHQTWAYAIDFKGLERYENNQELMYERLCDAYKQAAARINAERFIPSGDVIQALRRSENFKNESFCSDGLHLDPYGCFAVAAVWYSVLLGGDITKNTFCPKADMDFEKMAVIREIVDAVVKRRESEYV